MYAPLVTFRLSDRSDRETPWGGTLSFFRIYDKDGGRKERYYIFEIVVSLKIPRENT